MATDSCSSTVGQSERRMSKGYKWITNDQQSRLISPDTPIPDGWKLGNHHTRYIKTEEHRKAIGIAASIRNKGVTRSQETRTRMSEAQKKIWEEAKITGSRIEGNMRGAQKRKAIAEDRRNKKGLSWQEAVFQRDNRTCRKCNSTPTEKYSLHAHHIKPWDTYPELRYVVENGLTLCNRCHRKVEADLTRRKSRIIREVKEKLESLQVSEEQQFLLWLRQTFLQDPEI